MGVSINGGTPIAGWFTMENPNLKLMIEGYPHFRKGSYVLGGDRLDPTLSPIDCLPISHVHSIIYIELVRYIYIYLYLPWNIAELNMNCLESVYSWQYIVFTADNSLLSLQKLKKNLNFWKRHTPCPIHVPQKYLLALLAAEHIDKWLRVN